MASAMYSNSINRGTTGSLPSTPQPRMLGTTTGGWATTNKSGQYTSTSNLGQSGGYTSTNQYGQSGGYTTTSSQTLGQTVQSERVLSSNIIGETMMGPMPQEENIQYIEVPVIEEVIKHVAKKEYVEVEKRVPKYEYEWVERIVEIPQLQIVDRQVEVPQIQEVVRHVPIKQIVEVPKEIIRRVPKIETKIVEREVEVPGEIIEVPKPYLVENKIVVPRYTDKEVPTVVSQRLVPVISESETDYVDVDLKEYLPHLVLVDVYVPRPVARQLIASSKTEEHRVVDVPVGQFNSLLKQLNSHVQESDFQELLVKDQRGAIPIMPLTSGSIIVPPANQEWEATHMKGTLHFSHNASVGTVGGSGSATTTAMTTSYSTTPKYASSSTTTTRGPVISSQSYTTVPTTSYTSQSYTNSAPQTYTTSGHSYTTTPQTYTTSAPQGYTTSAPQSYTTSAQQQSYTTSGGQAYGQSYNGQSYATSSYGPMTANITEGISKTTETLNTPIVAA